MWSFMFVRFVFYWLQVIPRTLAQNCGGNIIRLLTTLRAKHAAGEKTFGVNGETGELADMNELRIWEPLAVKQQVYKTAVEVRFDHNCATIFVMNSRLELK